MPGIGGYYQSNASLELRSSKLGGILPRLVFGDEVAQCVDGVDGPGFAVACMDGADPVAQFHADDQGCVAFYGEIFEPAGVRSGISSAQWFLRTYREFGSKQLEAIEGKFVAAVYCKESNRLALISDKFGLIPLYYGVAGPTLSFATKINAVRDALGISSNFHTRGLTQFFTFGHLWNNDTFYDAIKCMESGSELTFDLETLKSSNKRYWRPAFHSRKQPDAAALTEVADSLQLAVHAQTQVDTVGGLGMSLSGGLDARTLIAIMGRRSPPLSCVSVGMEGSLDRKSARELAKLAQATFHEVSLNSDFLKDYPEHFARMLRLTDGHYLSQCIILPSLNIYRSLGVNRLIRGHAGELMHMNKAYNFSVDSSFPYEQGKEELRSWAFGRLKTSFADGVDEPILSGISAKDFIRMGEDTLEEALSHTDHCATALDRLCQLFLDQRTRRETAVSLSKFDSVTTTRVPYLNGRLVNAIFSASASMRTGEHMQAFVLRKFNAPFLAPANSNTGARVGASAIERTWAYYKMKALAKLGVAGYQPYERLGLWMKTDLREWVESVLLDPLTLDRGVLNPDCVRSCLYRHMNGRRNHSYLLLAMLVLELGIRSTGQPQPTFQGAA